MMVDLLRINELIAKRDKAMVATAGLQSISTRLPRGRFMTGSCSRWFHAIWISDASACQLQRWEKKDRCPLLAARQSNSPTQELIALLSI
jgi:hypothetical protein